MKTIYINLTPILIRWRGCSMAANNKNIYIGERYVPLYIGEWDVNKGYEPLSIVTYQGNSYTSKSYVPIGIDILNDTYWVLSGNFNGQIAGLTDDVRRNTEDIGELKSNTTIKDRYIILADNYGGAPTSSDSFLEVIKQYHTFKTGELYTAWQAGATFSLATSNNFDGMLASTANIVDNPDGITDIIVVGGMNDTVEADVVTGINSLCTTARALYPNSKVTLTGLQLRADNYEANYFYKNVIVPNFVLAMIRNNNANYMVVTHRLVIVLILIHLALV